MIEIIDDKKKKITISLQLEEIYLRMLSKNYLKEKTVLINVDTVSIDNIEQLKKLDSSKYKDYEVNVDFWGIKFFPSNYESTFWEWLKKLPKVNVSNLPDRIKAEEHDVEVADWDYCTALNDYGKDYIRQSCLKSNKNEPLQNGIILSKYIDLKNIINDARKILQWSYVIARDLSLHLSDYKDGRKFVLFCHTLNGTNIAGILAQLMGYDMFYVDHLGPYNKLNMFDFRKEDIHFSDYIIVTDLVCLGNEFIRASNIAQYLGGSVRGGVGFVRLGIDNIIDKYPIRCFATKFSENELMEMGYTVKTKLDLNSEGKEN